MANLEAVIEAQIQRVHPAVGQTAAVDGDLPNQRLIAELDEAVGFAEPDGQVVLNWPPLFCDMVKAT
jgi:hypothetical protein